MNAQEQQQVADIEARVARGVSLKAEWASLYRELTDSTPFAAYPSQARTRMKNRALEVLAELVDLRHSADVDREVLLALIRRLAGEAE